MALRAEDSDAKLLGNFMENKEDLLLSKPSRIRLFPLKYGDLCSIAVFSDVAEAVEVLWVNHG